MDYYQGVVTEYLRADRAMFVNTECCIQLNAADNPDKSGPHWYCDAVAANFRESRVYLCEISYSRSLGDLLKRLEAWSKHWQELCAALARDCSLPASWHVRPWLFVPESRRELLSKRLAKILGTSSGMEQMPAPRITNLEAVARWLYRSWSRQPEAAEDKT